MNYYFITGTSKGLGKSITELLLKDDTNFVYGYSRNCTIKHSNYNHTCLDLNDLENVKKLKFPTLKKVEKIILINNAGVIHINNIGNLNNDEIISTFSINLISPIILSNNFISKYNEFSKIIVNISSGASNSPIDGWSTYCASKASLDMFTRVFKHEQSLRGNSNTAMISPSPGIIDTEMQQIIRKSDFKESTRFIDYNKNKLLKTPKEIAQNILVIIENSCIKYID